MTPFFRLLCAVLVALPAACTGTSTPDGASTPTNGTTAEPDDGTPVASRRAVRAACGLPRAQLRRIRAGFHPERSGDLHIVPVPPNYYGNHSHSGPWGYLQRVPLVVYGPGHVPAVGTVDRPVTSADIAPTIAGHLDFDFDAPDGAPLRETEGTADAPPRVIVTVVWDGAGNNVLAEYPDAAPTLRRLGEEGVAYSRATVGTSPSVTPAVHSTIGTGAVPGTHGLTDLYIRLNGKVTSIRRSMGYLQLPTVADLYDRARENRPVVGMLGNNLSVGMMGKGTHVEGGDRDLLAVHGKDGWVPLGGDEKTYTFPSYVNEVGGLEEAVRAVDGEDGRLDDRWRDDLDLTDPGEWIVTPAYSRYQTSVVERLIQQEGVGADDVPDLLFVNYKQIDHVGHRWSYNLPQMRDVVESSDVALADLVEVLNARVGEGEWVLVVTADHGSTPDASVTGAWSIDIAELERDLTARFDDGDDRKVFQQLRVTQIWVDEKELAEQGHDVDDVAAFIMRYTRGENREDEASVPEEERNTRIFGAAFSGDVFAGPLPCLEPA